MQWQHWVWYGARGTVAEASLFLSLLSEAWMLTAAAFFSSYSYTLSPYGQREFMDESVGWAVPTFSGYRSPRTVISTGRVAHVDGATRPTRRTARAAAVVRIGRRPTVTTVKK